MESHNISLTRRPHRGYREWVVGHLRAAIQAVWWKREQAVKHTVLCLRSPSTPEKATHLSSVHSYHCSRWETWPAGQCKRQRGYKHTTKSINVFWIKKYRKQQSNNQIKHWKYLYGFSRFVAQETKEVLFLSDSNQDFWLEARSSKG